MSELQAIQATLESAARRRRWQNGWGGFWQGLLAGSGVWLGVLSLYKFLALPIWALTFGGLAGVALAAGGFFRGAWRKPALTEMARWLDDRQHLQERLGTALEVAAARGETGWRALLVADAARHLAKLDPRRLLPFRLPAASRRALPVLALCAGLGFVPEYRSPAWLQKQRDRENIQATGRQIAELARRSLEQRPPALEPTRQALDSVTELGDQLARQPLTRSEALRDLTSVADKLKEQTKDLASNPAMKRMEQAARQSGETAPTAEGLQKQMDALQKALGSRNTDSAALDKLKSDLQKAQQVAAGLPAKDSPAGAAAREQLAKSLAALAQQARDLGQSLAGLEEAIAVLQADQTDLLLRDLQAAMTDLDKLRDLAKALQQLQQQATRLGKDLAEQLKNGQAEAAQHTLQKMVEQLQSAAMTPEQLQKLLEEVSKAVDPAGQYGKVADFLKQTVAQLEQSQKPGAAQSLADAAKELERLLEQMTDAQSLLATLEALQRAQLAIATGQCFGQCRNPGAGQGGKPGSGVGTWADENGWLQVPEFTDLWDNSGIVRPDLDPRGQTDRGDGQLADNFAPTKIRGQISPGGSMPSITLKGVSLKGQSTVNFQEAVTAAQADAQSALNQDKVPRAYQGAVRDYFDDLKK